MTESEFVDKISCHFKTGKMEQTWAKIKLFEFIEKIWSQIFTALALKQKFIWSAVYLQKVSFKKTLDPQILVGQNALSHSNCRIFKSTTPSEETDEIAWCLACW